MNTNIDLNLKDCFLLPPSYRQLNRNSLLSDFQLVRQIESKSHRIETFDQAHTRT